LRRLLPGLFATLRRLLPGLFATLRRLLPGLFATLRRLLPGLFATLRLLLRGLLWALRLLLPSLLRTLRLLLRGLLWALRLLLPGLLWTLRLLLRGLLWTLRLLLLRLFLGSLLRSGGGLRALLFLRLFLLLLRPRLRLRRLGLRPLLLCGPRRRLLWLALLLFRRPGLFLFGISPLRVGRDDRPECQEQGAGKGSSNVLHRNNLRKCRHWTCTWTARGRGPGMAGMRGGTPCISAELAMQGAHFAALRGV
jgi:hypothetical protein